RSNYGSHVAPAKARVTDVVWDRQLFNGLAPAKARVTDVVWDTQLFDGLGPAKAGPGVGWFWW
ncbi:MAG: hypothetical protein VXZ17_01345, partial [Pseudomonadota bacterium]|nr:hypothetical protein [Pseudomonadota bacterium]